MKTYDKIILVHPTSSEISYDGIRSTDADFQKRVNEAFLKQIDLMDSEETIDITSDQIFKQQTESLFKIVL